MALLRVADVILDTSVKSGLNLGRSAVVFGRLIIRSSIAVPFEYYVARAALSPTSPTNLRGAVICSEFSGCSRVLIGSLSVNPWNTDKLVSAIQDAKHMLVGTYPHCWLSITPCRVLRSLPSGYIAIQRTCQVIRCLHGRRISYVTYGGHRRRLR